ncbi:uncharacterized protein LOC100367855 [Saccoglossus kowalevskii]|uniref:Uncharacterized protein LOC100367855 n=1 Tax=Saccoglossus kowalevskii TaxID=10224 RepID=A0ABM0H199_SACKO|nr:PREDICTED: uncharacterized protein LOC100367855 [Saccoglossus kowalevskii]
MDLKTILLLASLVCMVVCWDERLSARVQRDASDYQAPTAPSRGASLAEWDRYLRELSLYRQYADIQRFGRSDGGANNIHQQTQKNHRSNIWDYLSKKLALE